MKPYQLIFLLLIIIWGNSFAQLQVSTHDTTATPATTIIIPVILDNPDSLAISSFGMKMHFPEELAEFISVIKEGYLTSEWIQVNGNKKQKGVITIGGFNTMALRSSGALFGVEFHIKNDASGSGILQFTDFVDDLKYATTTASTLSILQQKALDAEFSAWVRKGRAPFWINFSDESAGNIQSRLWNMGDGAVEFKKNPSHLYTTEGEFAISLTVQDSLNSDMETKPDYITILPQPDFDVSTDNFLVKPDSIITVPLRLVNKPMHEIRAFGLKLIYPDSILTFVNTSNSGTLTENWAQATGQVNQLGIVNIGGYNPDPLSGEGVFLNVIFQVKSDASGSDTLKIRQLVDDFQDASTLDAIIKIGAPIKLTADFVADSTQGVVPFTVQFTDMSEGEIESWAWDFGDGIFHTEENPGHEYISAGKFSPSLTITGPKGLDSLTVSDMIIVTTGGKIDVSAENTSGKQDSTIKVPIILTNPKNIAVNKISFHVHFPSDLLEFSGLGTQGTLIENWFEKNASNIDSGIVSLESRDDNYATTSGVLLNLKFIVKSEANGSGEISLTDFNDGFLGATSTPATFTVKFEKPVAAFESYPRNGFAPLDVAFTDSSSGDITQWLWNFGDGASSVAQNPSHVYETAGNYTVSLAVTGPGGSDTLSANNYILVRDIGDFSLLLPDTSFSHCDSIILPLFLHNPAQYPIQTFSIDVTYPDSLLEYEKLDFKNTLMSDWPPPTILAKDSLVRMEVTNPAAMINSSGVMFYILFKSKILDYDSAGIEITGHSGDLRRAVAVNSVIHITNHLPEPPTLTAPADGAIFTIPVDSIRFSWTAANDPDLCDSVQYQFMLSKDSLFANSDSIVHYSPVITAASYSVIISDSWYEKKLYWTVFAFDPSGIPVQSKVNGIYSLKITSVAFNRNGLPKDFALLQNHPNPFNLSTTIEYHLPKISHVRIAIYDVTGRRVRVLSDEKQSAGVHFVTWDGADTNHMLSPTGVYIVRFEADHFVQTKKMLLLK